MYQLLVCLADSRGLSCVVSRGTARMRVWTGHQQLYTVYSEPLVIQTSLLSESDKSVQISESFRYLKPIHLYTEPC